MTTARVKWRIDGYGWLLALGFVGSAILKPTIGPNVALVDALLVVAILVGLGQILTDQGGPGWALTRRVAAPIWLIMVGSILALFGVGLTGWALRQLLIGLFSFAVFIASYQLLAQHPRRIKQLRSAMMVGIAFALLTLAADGGLATRSEATFPNPNYAGHYIVTALFVAFPLLAGSASRVALGTMTAIALVFPASFGSLLMTITALAYEAWRQLRRHPHLLALTLAALLLSFWAVVNAGSFVRLDDVALSQGLSADRFERSQGGRLGTWDSVLSSFAAEPLGIGPGGVAARDVAGGKEAHSLYVAFLVERGVLGLLGLIWLGVVLWRFAPREGITRRLLVALIAANFVRETLHYRHMWLALAAALAWDHLQATEASADDPDRPRVRASVAKWGWLNHPPANRHSTSG